MAIWGRFLLMIAVVFLTAASCSRGVNPEEVTTAIDQATVTLGIDFENKPANTITSVAAGTASIYLSARVVNPTRTTSARIRWSKAGAIIATQDFNGGRGNDNQFDFVQGDNNSYFASQVDRPGTSWPLGDYKIEIFLNGRLDQTLNFKVVTDQDQDQNQARNMVSSLIFGSRVNAQNQLTVTGTTFDPSTPNLYAAIGLNQVPVGSNLELAVRYVRDNVAVTSYKVQYQEGDSITIEIDSDQVFRRSRPNRSWPAGSYEVTVLINGVQARTSTFVVR